MRYLLHIIVAAVLLVHLSAAANVKRQTKHYRNKELDRKLLLEEISEDMDTNVIKKQHKFSIGVVAITHSPNKSIGHTPGTVLPLTCEGIGSPAPKVRWFRNNEPVYEFDSESNEALDSSPSSLARINSTLLVKHTDSVDEYTCVLVAGLKTTRATSIVYRLEGPSLTPRIPLLPLSPTIVVWYSVYLGSIGSVATLPCEARGHPRPKVTWDLAGRDLERFTVLKSGELIIHNLRWSDLGEYTCTATNSHGVATTTTFLYPAKAT